MEKIKLNIYNDSIECDEALSMLAKKNIVKKPIHTIIISSKQRNDWSKEISKRIHQLTKWNTDVKVFDVDECMECGIMSKEHCEEMLDFLYNS